jgi:NADP-dependent 3-hydroxy acid dehydrogenase YdfG
MQGWPLRARRAAAAQSRALRRRARGAISEGLRHEVGGNVRTTTIMPGADGVELKTGTSDAEPYIRRRFL